MLLLSTGGRVEPTPLNEALRRGLAPDGGLYVPQALEPLPAEFFEQLPENDLLEISERVVHHLLGDDLTREQCRDLVGEALDFPIPLVGLCPGIWILELFHGPTLAFKDVGARFLARLLARTSDPERPATVLVATSGDTGGAVARAFFGVRGTRVAILYPRGKVSPVQERQFTTLGGNVQAYAVEGTFDDCQRLVKEAFRDQELVAALGLTSANSINIGRLLPQVLYYFHAAAQLKRQDPGETSDLLFSIPSGNFGNLTAGLIARRLGLEARFLAATNRNDVVPSYLASGIFQPRDSVRTVSNAMDVGNPSNFARILHLYEGKIEALRRDVQGFAFDDEATRAAIREIEAETGYVMDPHTAVGYLALREALPTRSGPTRGVVLATAHPAKFQEVVEPAIGRQIELPPALAERLQHPVLSKPLGKDLPELVSRLRQWTADLNALAGPGANAPGSSEE